jgi:acetolactate synthase-1/2/3 large subunit
MVETIDRISSAGMALFEGRLARLLRSHLNTGGAEILIYDNRGVSHYLRVDELSDPHYMAWDEQHLIVASTGTNSLSWITLGGQVVRRWRAPGENDSWHLNDVCLVNDRIYACAFGRFEHYRGYKDNMMRGDGIVFDIASGKDVVTNLCAPHSPRFLDNAWTVCDSLRNSVVQVDSNGRRIKEAKLRSFTRGMAVTDDFLIVGESVQRGSGEDRETGSVAILRRSDFGFVDRVDVPFREVSEIVVAPRSLVNGVKTGFRTNPLREGESDQLQMFRDIGIRPKRLWAVNERLTPDQCKVKIDAEFPAHFVTARPTLVACTVQNLSESFLCSELPFPVHIAYRWKTSADSDDFGDRGIRIRLPRMLPPGESVQISIDVLAPEREGTYELLITLVQEFVAWFDLIDPANACRAMVSVTAGKANEVSAPVT